MQSSAASTMGQPCANRFKSVTEHMGVKGMEVEKLNQALRKRGQPCFHDGFSKGTLEKAEISSVDCESAQGCTHHELWSEPSHVCIGWLCTKLTMLTKVDNRT